jgi:uncharacterized membrane protein
MLSSEVISFFGNRVNPSETQVVRDNAFNFQISAISVVWALYAAIAIGIAYLRRIIALRGFALGLIAFLVAKFVLYDTSALTGPESSILLAANFYFASAVAVFATLMFAAYMTTRHRDQLLPLESNLYNLLVVLANTVALWGLSVESWRFFTGLEAGSTGDLDSAKHLTLTILWTVYAMGLITLGVLRRSRTLRLAGIGLMLLPIAKLFGFDVFLLEQGYRVAAFVSMAVILLALGLAYQKYSEVFRGFFMAASSDAEVHRVA